MVCTEQRGEWGQGNYAHARVRSINYSDLPVASCLLSRLSCWTSKNAPHKLDQIGLGYFSSCNWMHNSLRSPIFLPILHIAISQSVASNNCLNLAEYVHRGNKWYSVAKKTAKITEMTPHTTNHNTHTHTQIENEVAKNLIIIKNR